jgi:hypothetical protein
VGNSRDMRVCSRRLLFWWTLVDRSQRFALKASRRIDGCKHRSTRTANALRILRCIGRAMATACILSLWILNSPLLDSNFNA